MRALIQRVTEASVTIEKSEHSRISRGLLILIGIVNEDTDNDIEYLCKKVVNLRIFEDGNGVMNESVLQTKGQIMVISQFTLHANTKKGNRPSYIEAAKSDIAIPIYEKFCQLLKVHSGLEIKTGVFGADMKVSLVNDGPVTILIDSKEK